MTEIIFIVDDFDENGVVVTAMDRIRAISDNWQPNLYDKNKFYYQKYTGKKIKFVKKSDITSYDKSKKYFYFIPMNDWHCTKQMLFNVLDKGMQFEFAQNGVGFYFCQDFEMYPNLNINFFGNYIAWLRLCQAAHSFLEIPIYFAMCSEIVPRFKIPLTQAFPGVKFINSPLLVIFSREELALKNDGLDISKIADDYLNSPKQKSYMALTRDSKYHRLTMMHGLRSRGLLEDGYVSNLMPREYDRLSVYGSSMYSDEVRVDMRNLLPYMAVDELNPELIPGIYHGIGGDLPLQHMATSCYDLVQETATNYQADMPIDMAVVTEKVIKSLLLARPFMINGGQGCLRVLRHWGFKTYPQLFDERYDELENFIDRQEIITSNVQRWAGKYDEFMSYVRTEDVVSILRHNVEHVLGFDAEDVLAREILSA